MKRTLAAFFSFIWLALASSLALGQTPTLIQSFVSAGNPNGIGENGNAYKITLPNSVLSGDALVLTMDKQDGTTVSSITDSIGNTWPSSASLTVSGGSGAQDLLIYVLPNSRPGVETITITYSAAQQENFFRIFEFNNIATSSPVTGTVSNARVTSSGGVSCGSFTPGNNNANGGNLILAVVDTAAQGSSVPTSFAAGGSFTLHDADIFWKAATGFPKASEYFVQTTSAAINPSITINGDTTNSYNCGAIALKAASAGGTAPSGIRIIKHLQFYNSGLAATSLSLQAPTLGNLRVLASSDPADGYGTFTVTDSESNTWSRYNPSGTGPQMFWLANAAVNQNLKVTITTNSNFGGNTVDTSVWDIIGSSTTQPGAEAFANTSTCNLASVANQPDITPQKNNSLIIAVAPDGLGPVLGITSPTGAITDMVEYTGKTDGSMYDSGDGWAHFYTTSTAAENWSWTINQNGFGCLTSSAVEFLAAPMSARVSHDFNGDGKSDIAFRDTSGNAAVWLMNGTSILQSAGLGSAATSWSVAGQRDFNGDGTSDWLWHDTSGNVAIWFLNGAQVTSSVGVGNVPTVWSIAGTGDFNGDGKGDVLWADGSGDVAVWLMNGATVVTSAGLGTAPAGWSIVGTGDFNGDGKTDILWQDTSGDVAIWFMNGAQVTSSVGVGTAPAGWSIVGTGDFNGDGKYDIVWRNTSGAVAVWLMNGAQLSQSAGLGSPPTGWSIAETGDFNGDGKSDILWQDISGNVAIWFMNGVQVTPAGVGSVPTVWSIQGINAD